MVILKHHAPVYFLPVLNPLLDKTLVDLPFLLLLKLLETDPFRLLLLSQSLLFRSLTFCCHQRFSTIVIMGMFMLLQ